MELFSLKTSWMKKDMLLLTYVISTIMDLSIIVNSINVSKKLKMPIEIKDGKILVEKSNVSVKNLSHIVKELSLVTKL
jgi:hypothetical protein